MPPLVPGAAYWFGVLSVMVMTDTVDDFWLNQSTGFIMGMGGLLGVDDDLVDICDKCVVGLVSGTEQGAARRHLGATSPSMGATSPSLGGRNVFRLASLMSSASHRRQMASADVSNLIQVASIVYFANATSARAAVVQLNMQPALLSTNLRYQAMARGADFSSTIVSTTTYGPTAIPLDAPPMTPPQPPPGEQRTPSPPSPSVPALPPARPPPPGPPALPELLRPPAIPLPPAKPQSDACSNNGREEVSLAISTILLGVAALVALLVLAVVLVNAGRAIAGSVARAKAQGDAQTSVLRAQVKAMDAQNALLAAEVTRLKTDLRFARYTATAASAASAASAATAASAASAATAASAASDDSVASATSAASTLGATASGFSTGAAATGAAAGNGTFAAFTSSPVANAAVATSVARALAALNLPPPPAATPPPSPPPSPPASSSTATADADVASTTAADAATAPPLPTGNDTPMPSAAASAQSFLLVGWSLASLIEHDVAEIVSHAVLQPMREAVAAQGHAWSADLEKKVLLELASAGDQTCRETLGALLAEVPLSLIIADLVAVAIEGLRNQGAPPPPPGVPDTPRADADDGHAGDDGADGDDRAGTQGGATLASKFVGEAPGANLPELSFGDVAALYSGLEALVGKAPAAGAAAVEAEHRSARDSHSVFETGNYGVRTTSAIEYVFVVDPDRGNEMPVKKPNAFEEIEAGIKLALDKMATKADEVVHEVSDKVRTVLAEDRAVWYPIEKKLVENSQRRRHRRTPQALSDFRQPRREINRRLCAVGTDPITDLELVCSRLCACDAARTLLGPFFLACPPRVLPSSPARGRLRRFMPPSHLSAARLPPPLTWPCVSHRHGPHVRKVLGGAAWCTTARALPHSTL